MSDKYIGIDRVLVERKINDLEMEEWIFWFHENTLYLDAYYKKDRETKRHKFKAVTAYERLKDHHYSEFGRIPDSRVELPVDVVNEALEKIRSRITVKRWSERG